jgi:Flp pilus assembly protein TadG
MVSSLRRCLRSFKVCVRANVAMTFALATIPVVGFVGSAVDYSRAHSMKAAMQGALDATALMLSKKAANMTPAQISSAATAYFSAVFTRPEAKNINVTASYSSDGGSQVLLSGSAALGSVSRRRRSGARHAFASRLRSTTPDPWPTTARWTP